MTERQRSTIAARGPASELTEAAANADAISNPIGVATTNPVFGWDRRTPGVASACRPRKPALARKPGTRMSLRRVALPRQYSGGERDVNGREEDDRVTGMVLPFEVHSGGENHKARLAG